MLMRIVFIGTPSFALPSLKEITQAGFETVAVITQPDRKQGRGMKLTPPVVKIQAMQLGIPVLQPSRIRDQEFIAYLQGLAPEAIVVVAYGQILPQQILNIPKLGCINLHASLLPELRGAAPIQWSIILGKESTGVTTMYMDEGMDTGDIILQKEIEISDDETSGDLLERLSIIGADLLLATLRLIEEGKVQRTKQNELHATYAPLITKKDAIIPWSKPAIEIYNLIRGLNPVPGAYTFLEGKRIKIYHSRVVQGGSESQSPGEIISLEVGGMVVACGRGHLSILEVQPEGKGRMDIKAFLAGHRIAKGAKFIPPQSGRFS